MKHIKLFEAFENAVIIPTAMQKKLDTYASKNWWIGKNGSAVFNGITDVDLMKKELDRINKFSNGQLYVSISTSPKNVTIDVCEITDDMKKFEKAADKVPYFTKIGKCNINGETLDVCISYSTARNSSDSKFDVQDLKEFIDLN